MLMSIKPIDLQTLFVKMDEVSKDQSIAKGQSALQQSNAAKAQVAKELEEDRRVTETPEDDETQAVKDDDSENAKDSEKRKKNDSDDSAGDSDGREVVTDPDVGRHIDLTG